MAPKDNAPGRLVGKINWPDTWMRAAAVRLTQSLGHTEAYQRGGRRVHLEVDRSKLLGWLFRFPSVWFIAMKLRLCPEKARRLVGKSRQRVSALPGQLWRAGMRRFTEVYRMTGTCWIMLMKMTPSLASHLVEHMGS